VDSSEPYVYPDRVILEPCGKLILFKQQTWEDHYAEQYRLASRQRYIDHYESLHVGPVPPTASYSRKRKFEEADGHDDYCAALQRFATAQVSQNEFDRYMDTPVPSELDTLGWWKAHQNVFPRLSMMARDTFAVPATGAGVERQFSLSGRVATWDRALLKPETICEMMRYKDYLNRIGKPLTRNKGRKEDGGRIGTEVDETEDEATVEVDEDDHDNLAVAQTERRLIAEWETEWWQRADARLVLG